MLRLPAEARATARRHAYLTLRNPYVDILAGQTFDVFGFQNFYLGASLLGLPNQVSTRTAQSDCRQTRRCRA